MPLIVFGRDHKAHLAFLSTVEEEADDATARQLYFSGTNPKVYSAAARVPSETVQNGVQGLMYLLTESSKLLMNDLDFHDSIIILGYPADLNELLLKIYMENRTEIRDIMAKLSMVIPSYQNMHWRLDAQVASRTLKQQAEPAVVMKLDTVGPGTDTTSVLLQTDPTTLAHITRELEAALKAVKSSHYRRITRAIK
eukprot:gene6343-13205_t